MKLGIKENETGNEKMLESFLCNIQQILFEHTRRSEYSVNRLNKGFALIKRVLVEI